MNIAGIFEYVGRTWGLAGFLLLTFAVLTAAVLVAVVYVVARFVLVPLLRTVTALPDMVSSLTAAQAGHTAILREIEQALAGLREDSSRQYRGLAEEIGRAARRFESGGGDDG